MNKNVLMVTQMDGAAGCAAVVERQLGLQVQLASADAKGAEMIWQHAGAAVPVQVNFAISGCARLVREVRSALARSAQERMVARRSAMQSVQSELKSAVTGILLQSELALREPAGSPDLQIKLRQLVEMAGNLRERLQAGA